MWLWPQRLKIKPVNRKCKIDPALADKGLSPWAGGLKWPFSIGLALLLWHGSMPQIQPALLPAERWETQKALAASPMRVVILPFHNLTGKSEDQWLGESFAESLTMGLLKVEALHVIERAQISQVLREQQFGQSGLVDESTAPRLGKLLGAEVVILGSYQKVGEQIQANVRFVHLETGQINKKWATQVEGELQGLFGLQKRLARELISQMQVPASESDVQKVESVFHETQSTEAHRYYVEALSKWRRGANPKAIIRDFKAALNADPNYALAYAGLAEMYIQMSGDRKKLLVLPPSQGMGVQGVNEAQLAEEYAQKALALNPELAQTWRALAWIQQYQGNFERARELSQKALKINPRDSDSLSAFISIRMQQGSMRSEQVLTELKNLGANLDDPWLKFSLASMAILQESFQSHPKFDWIETLLSDAARDLPDNPFIPLMQSTLPLRLGQTEAALEMLDKAVALGQDSAELLYTSAALYATLGKLDKANSLVEQALLGDPHHVGAKTEKVNILDALGQKEQANALFAQLEQENPENTMLFFRRGVSLIESQQNLTLAEAYLKRALKLWEKEPMGLGRGLILSLLGGLLLQLQKTEEAIPIYQELRADPVYYDQAYEMLAPLLAQKDDFAGALESYRNFVTIKPEVLSIPEKKRMYQWFYLLHQNQLEPNNPAVLNDLAQLAITFKNYPKARDFLSQAMKGNSQNPTLYYNLGCLEMAQARWPESRSAFQQAVNLNPAYLKSWFNLALVYRELGQMGEARSALMRVLELDSGQIEARELLKKWVN